MAARDPWSTHYGLETIKPRAEGSFRGRIDLINRLYIVQVAKAVRQFLRQPVTLSNAPELRAKATAVVDNYEANQNIARALGQSYHFKFYGFWQPMLFYGHKPLVPFERKITDLDATRRSRFHPQPVIAVYQEAERRAPTADFVYLADIFDAEPEAIYIDEAHLGPHGNELAANAIAKYIAAHPSGTEFHLPKAP
jgi:hypothetical protein